MAGMIIISVVWKLLPIIVYKYRRLDCGDDAIALTRETVIIIEIMQIKYVQID